ncbi:hypothetical protein [Massilia sp. CF038]|uniref:hypothetical protein n=1 Tax=Massilia sp. CF038 TaxID=1881045 RepID=UPI0009127F5D|nr:hypothetical protein [Massilia sp. CF038]SHH67290.1 hypothetical protein SAMN05428948_4877 [Massilia sp. CF038]
MTVTRTPLLSLSAALLIASLSACGGGGGSAPAPAPAPGSPVAPSAPVVPVPPATPVVPVVPVTPATPDGLGAWGHVDGTVRIEANIQAPYGTPDQRSLAMAAALADDGRGLAVWQLVGAQNKADRIVAWSQSDAAGAWPAGKAIPQAGSGNALYRLTLRTNAAGNAALGMVTEGTLTEASSPRTLRFIQGSGWDASSYKPLGAFGEARRTVTGAGWDLSILDSNAVTSSGRTGDYFSVVQTAPDGQQKSVLDTSANAFSSTDEHSNFAPRPDGFGLWYTTKQRNDYSSDLIARLAAVDGTAFATFPIGNFGQLCSALNEEGPLVAATTSKTEGVLAVTVGKLSGCTTHALHAVRIYTLNTLSVDSRILNSPSTYLPVAPVIRVDKDGNALMVWLEFTGERNKYQDSDKVQMMWSKSMYGGGWSTPVSVFGPGVDLTKYSTRRNPISLAMNANGQAVLALLVDSLNPVITTTRFDFQSGWSAPKVIANKAGLSVPAVAINASGQALVVYSGTDLTRVNGVPGLSPDPFNLRIFALRF